MERTSFAKMRCSLGRSLEIVGDWWSPLILRDLFLGLSRFDELVENLGISRNLLASRLKALIEKGVVERAPYQERPRRYAYRLTDSGRDLVPSMLALTAWGDRWAQPDEGAPLVFVHTACGQRFEPQVTCSACGGPATADTVAVLPGPGGGAGPGTALLAQYLAKRA